MYGVIQYIYNYLYLIKYGHGPISIAYHFQQTGGYYYIITF